MTFDHASRLLSGVLVLLASSLSSQGAMAADPPQGMKTVGAPQELLLRADAVIE